jgi:hypothetical protein
MVNTVQNKVASDSVLVIWDPVSLSMKYESVERIFEEGPED